MKLFRSNINQLAKVATKLAYSQRMDGGHVILSPENQKKKDDAEQHIYDAIKLLRSIV